MFWQRRKRNVYNHVLREEERVRNERIRKGFALGLPAAVVAAFMGITANMSPPETEPGYLPLRDAEQALEDCSPWAEDINGNGNYETLCMDGKGNLHEVRYRQDGTVWLKLAACAVDPTRPYKEQKCR